MAIDLRKINLKNQAREYLTIVFGTILYAVGISYFMLPYQLTTGGVAGIGALIFYATGFEVQNTYLIINIALLVFAVKELGWKFCVKTIFAVLTLTIMLWFVQRTHEFFGSPKLVGDELFMACLIGAIFEGAGLGCCFMAGGSTGGTDIIAAIVNKYKNMSLGTVIMLLDIIIISSCYLVFHDIQRVIFGFVLLVVSSFTLDYVVSRYRQAVEFKIYSRNPNAIAEAIIKTGRGVTLLEGEGYYTKSERKVIISVVPRRDQIMWMKMIKSIDPFAFVTMGNVSGVWGEGFEAMKVKMKKEQLKRHVLVLTTDDESELAEAREVFGDGYDVRSLRQIGCDVNNPVNSDILCNDAVLKGRYVKRFYGFDCLSKGKTLDEFGSTIYALVTGDAVSLQYLINKFGTIQEVKDYLDNNKR